MSAADRLEQIANHEVYMTDADDALLLNVAALVRACEVVPSNEFTKYEFHGDEILAALAKLQEQP